MKETKVIIEKNSEVADSIYEATLLLDEPAQDIWAGKFLNVSVGDGSHILKRPFGISDYDAKGEKVKFCYQVRGEGTEKLSKLKCGTELMATLPLGNGFLLDKNWKKIAILAGGMGVCPFGGMGKSYPDKHFVAYLGFRNKKAECLTKRISRFADLRIVYDDEPLENAKNAVELFLNEYESENFDAILCCGPKPMFRALKNAIENRKIDIPCFVSLEERMGCGVGACLVCVCKQAKAEGNVRVCKDGPVFPISEVEL
ncbi:MAG: dihydroorotate dehydrogenase electron transfer subunit [Clostridia bacterium]|nr:dihydroorotate dehydrogenase electron transfer subunit [Clostridia bacterium]